jgi:predicted dithiol-disulfide oxidoreductase (DUF899 family)
VPASQGAACKGDRTARGAPGGDEGQGSGGIRLGRSRGMRWARAEKLDHAGRRLRFGVAAKEVAMNFPNENRKYRKARNKLLRAEIELRRKLEAVAALRRKLPAGGAVPEDYVFASADGEIKLSRLFTRGRTLVAYSFMYGPQMAQACPSCTSILDSLDRAARHLRQVTDLVVIARSPIARILEHAKKRGWSQLRLLSSAKNTYNPDYGAETPDGAQMPMLNVFRKERGALRHFWGSELLYAKTDPGQEPRHVDLIWPIWQVLDFTPEGRGKDWNPRLDYGR